MLGVCLNLMNRTEIIHYIRMTPAFVSLELLVGLVSQHNGGRKKSTDPESGHIKIMGGAGVG